MAEKWVDFPLPDGSYSDPTRPWSQQDVVNYLPVRSEQQGTRSPVKFTTVPGLGFYSRLGAGPVRGMRDVEGALYVVSGPALYRVWPDGDSVEIGEIPGTGLVAMTHNQVVGGNQLVIATGSAGYIYDTRDDSLINPSDPPTEAPENPTSPGGGTPSTGLGPNGGYPDDDEPTMPLPTTGVDVIADGDFTDPGDLDDWDNRLGDPLTGWTVAAGKAHYSGIGPSGALYYPAQYRMSPWPLPRYSVAVAGDLRCDAGAKVAIGMYVGYLTAGEIPNALYSSTPAEYLVETPVSYTFEYKAQDVGITANGEYVIPHATPVMHVYSELDTTVTADFDNISVTITEVAEPATDPGLPNLDFSSGLTGWKVFPESSAAPTITVSGGEVSIDPINATGDYRQLVHETPLSSAAYNHYVHITADAWSNDPTSYSAVPQNGVALGLIIRGPNGQYITPPRIGAYERGDWTAREAWWRQWMPDSALADGYTVHLCVSLRAALGYRAKIRNIAVEVTDNPVT